jgi:PAS domain S-box-containing protein
MANNGTLNVTSEEAEAQRLAVLRDYNILDTPSEPAFDDIVQLARIVCDTPFALVSLVSSDRQWFKARVGLENDETPMNESVCFHGLREDSLLIIPDLTADPRTRDNPLVVGDPHIRFYAGAVLRSPEGAALGMLCAIGFEPRPAGLQSDQVGGLLALARQTMAQLDSGRGLRARDDALVREREDKRVSRVLAEASQATTRRLNSERLRFQNAQKAGRVGVFELDVETDTCLVSPELCRIMGVPIRRSYQIQELQADILPEDMHLPSTVATRKMGVSTAEIEFRLKRASDGAVRWIARRADFQLSPDGKPARMLGIVQDITDRKTAERHQAALIALGDELRGAKTLDAIVASASRIVGSSMEVSRAGYATVDTKAGEFNVIGDWTANDARGLAGRYDLALFSRTIERLGIGSTIATSDNTTAGWLRDDLATYEAIDVRASIETPLLENGQVVGVLFAHADAPREWSDSEVEFVSAVADRTHAAVAKVKAEEEQQFLNQELLHRLKNTLAIVQAMAHQTFRAVQDKGALKSFDDRLKALGSAHDVLTRRSWGSARIRSIVEKIVEQHGSDKTIDVHGMDLTVGPKAALSLALLLHELSTNALKHGSLSTPMGRVGISWQVDRGLGSPEFVLRWEESGGPPATKPARRGFGTKLIQMGLSGTGDADLRYEENGLTASFRAPLSQITAT